MCAGHWSCSSLRVVPQLSLEGSSGFIPSAAVTAFATRGCFAAVHNLVALHKNRGYRKHRNAKTRQMINVRPANRKASSMTNLNLEVPAEIRVLAEKTVEQARKAFEDFVVAAQKATAQSEAATASLTTGAKDVSSKAIGYAEANVKAAFDLAQKLI